MNDVAEVDLMTLWGCVSTQTLERTVDICLRALKCRGAFVGAFSDTEGLTLRATAGSVHPTDTGQSGIAVDEARVMTAPIRVGARRVGTLGVVAAVARDWQPEDRLLLGGFADCLAGHIELHQELVQRRTVDAVSHAAVAGFLSASEHIPALVFERRKIEAGRSTYRFFGRGKIDLPAVRDLTELGESSPLNFVFREDRDAVRAAMLRSNLEETDLDITFRIKDFGLRIRWVRSQSIIRRENDGTVVWHGFVSDISDLMATREPPAEPVPASPPISGEVVDLLKAIVETCDVVKSETQPARIAAHADTIQSTSKALLALLLPNCAGSRGPSHKNVADTRPEREATPRPAVASTGARILIADDLDLNRKLISDMLGIDGHTVDCVADGAAAVEAVKSNHYDLVLMDMIMPGMDGLAATQAIRALPGAIGSIPIIGLTAHSQEEELDRCRAAGMDAVLTKPMSMDALSAIVGDWTRGRQAA